PSTSAHRSALGPAPPLGPNRGNVGPPISSSLITQISGPGVTSAWIFSFWIDVPVCDPPLGNDTHLPHSGRMHSCPNTLELAINAAKITRPRIHSSVICSLGVTGITRLKTPQACKFVDVRSGACRCENMQLPSMREFGRGIFKRIGRG